MDGGRISEGFPLDKGSHALKNLVRQQKAVINPPKVKHGKTGKMRLFVKYN